MSKIYEHNRHSQPRSEVSKPWYLILPTSVPIYCCTNDGLSVLLFTVIESAGLCSISPIICSLLSRWHFAGLIGQYKSVWVRARSLTCVSGLLHGSHKRVKLRIEVHCEGAVYDSSSNMCAKICNTSQDFSNSIGDRRDGVWHFLVATKGSLVRHVSLAA